MTTFHKGLCLLGRQQWFVGDADGSRGLICVAGILPSKGVTAGSQSWTVLLLLCRRHRVLHPFGLMSGLSLPVLTSWVLG